MIATDSHVYDKTISNIQEVRARGGELFVFADQDTRIEPSDGINIVNLHDHAGLLSPILHVPTTAYPDQTLSCSKGQDHGLDRALDRQLIELCAPALDDARAVSAELTVRNDWTSALPTPANRARGIDCQNH